MQDCVRYYTVVANALPNPAHTVQMIDACMHGANFFVATVLYSH